MTGSEPTDPYHLRIPLDRFPPVPERSLEQIEGPYYIGGEEQTLTRRDVREDCAGVQLDLGVRVVMADDGRPLAGVAVDMWQCDARGAYSGFDNDPDELIANGARQRPRNADRFLRGTQCTDQDGIVTFRTIFPGWYVPRAPHVHLRLRVDDRAVHTTQLYFPEHVTAWVAKQKPYAQRADRRTVTNEDDFVIGFFDGVPDAWAHTERVGSGLLATANVSIDPDTDATEFELDDPPPHVTGPPPGIGRRHGFMHPADRVRSQT